MTALSAQLSALAGSLDDLTHRVTALAEGLETTDDADAASELYEIERSLQHASRRLERLLR